MEECGKKLTSSWTDFDVSGMRDVRTVVVEGREYVVNASLLAMYSRFFHALFFGGFKESTEKKVTLNDIDGATFTALLNILYPCHHAPTTVECTLSLLDVAYQFDIPYLLGMCHDKLYNEVAAHCAFENQLAYFGSAPTATHFGGKPYRGGRWKPMQGAQQLQQQQHQQIQEQAEKSEYAVTTPFLALAIAHRHGDFGACSNYANCLRDYESFIATYSKSSSDMSNDVKAWILDFIAKKFPMMVTF